MYPTEQLSDEVVFLRVLHSIRTVVYNKEM